VSRKCNPQLHLQPTLHGGPAQEELREPRAAQAPVHRRTRLLTAAFRLEIVHGTMRRQIADWSACALAVVILALGGLVVVKPAIDHWDDLYRGDPFAAGTTSEIVQETAGKKVDRTRTTTTEDASSFPERLLGDAGVLLARLLLVALTAFVAAAVLQRAILGEYALRRSAMVTEAVAPARNGARRAPKPETPTPYPVRNGPAGEEPTAANLGPGIAKLVAARREALGLSQRELAKRAGISHTVISRIEGGEHSPSPKTLERLAEALR
jgi:DNA-binding XRE family transcriptional regulator